MIFLKLLLRCWGTKWKISHGTCLNVLGRDNFECVVPFYSHRTQQRFPFVYNLLATGWKTLFPVKIWWNFYSCQGQPSFQCGSVTGLSKWAPNKVSEKVSLHILSLFLVPGAGMPGHNWHSKDWPFNSSSSDHFLSKILPQKQWYKKQM